MKKLIATLLVLCLFCGAAFAETAEVVSAGEPALSEEDVLALNGGKNVLYRQDGGVTFVDGTCTKDPVLNEADAGRVVRSAIPLLGGNERTHFDLWRVLHDVSGNVYYVFQQMYADTTVMGGAVKVITDASGAMIGLNASVVTNLPDEQEREGITADAAEAVVIAHEKVRGIAEPAVLAGQTRRIVLPVNRDIDLESETDNSRFVWAVYTTNPTEDAKKTDMPYLAHYVTTAGEYLYSLPTMLPGDAAGEAGYDAEYTFQFMEPAEYTGYVDLSDGTEKEISITLMRDTRDGRYYLGNLERRIVVADCWEFLYNHGHVVMDSSEDNQAWDQVGLLSLYNYCRAYDFYKAIGWPSCDGENTPIVILKDFCDQNHKPINNAAYAGKYYGWQCFLCSSINDFAQCLDVCGHEYTHGVTHTVMTYNSYFNDYGAINEAMSDILGNICEMMAGATEDTTWKIAECSKNTLRSMSDPHAFGQPEYTWDVYYTANVKDPTEINDRGGVHTDSSLLNLLAYRLCAQGGMTLEQARNFWFAVDCTMVPGTDFPQLTVLLPWVLRHAGLDDYRTVLDESVAAVRLGDKEIPETLGDRQALLTLNLPDNEVFNTGRWSLAVLSIDTESVESKLTALNDSMKSGEMEEYPEGVQKLVKNAQEEEARKQAEEEERKSKSLGERFTEWLISLTEENKPEEEAANEPAKLELTDEETNETVLWLRDQIRDVIYNGNGTAGQDGHTIRMVSKKGRTIPLLMYAELEPNSSVLKQMNFLLYLRGRWVDVTGLAAENVSLLERVGLLITSGLVLDILHVLFTGDYLGALTLDVKGGEHFEIPNTGLENVTLKYNLASLQNSVQVEETENKRLSRTEPRKEEPEAEPAAEPEAEPAAKAEPTAEPEAAEKADQEKVYWGDINRDGELNTGDIVQLQMYLAGDPNNIDVKLCDLNGDGVVNQEDLALLGEFTYNRMGDQSGNGTNNPPFIWGDIDRNGELNTGDVVRLQQYLSGDPAAIDPMLCDLNGDGVVDQEDLALLQRYIINRM